MRFVVPALAAALLTAGCGSGLTESQSREVCGTMNLTGFHGAVRVVNSHGVTGQAEAAQAIRNAVRDFCPEHSAEVGG